MIQWGKYEIEQDKHQCILRERYMGTAKNSREPKEQVRETYHSNIAQCAITIMEREGKASDDLGDVVSTWRRCCSELKDALSTRSEDRGLLR